MITQMQEEIRPSADLRNHYSEISRECRENRTAVIITVNGRGDTVSIGYQQYKNMKAKLELLEMLDDGERDYREGRTSPENVVFERLYARLADVNKK
ncbi:MAG: type II toxin-antitoxin system Phd/YefM family antitoxin [Flexilinea sp.]|nr:type II toxin-antitoxin system Phd/YefM family antitoxin [Flexilinea sp.]